MSANTLAQRIDGWVNALTDLGHSTRDKAMAVSFGADAILTSRDCEDLYHHDDLANRIVSAVPDEALRQGVEIQAVDESDQDRAKEIERKLRSLSAVDRMREGMLWGRCKGGSALLLLVEGAGLPDEPLDDGKIKSLEEIRFVDREELTALTKYSDPLRPSYGLPELYTYQPRDGTPVTVHESRLILFSGAHTSALAKAKNSGWDHSVLQRVIGALRSANTNWQSVVHMMNDFSQAVFKISGLIEAIEGNKGETISLRMALMDKVRAVSKALVLDAGDPEHNIPAEEFQVIERGALAGIDSIIQQTWLRLATAARMPVSILMGQAPAGLNATGAIDLRWWYDTIRTAQEHEIKPRLERIVGVIARELYGDVEDSFIVTFPSLWQMTPAEEADLRSKIAATDKAYIEAMVALPEEIAISRWGKGRYSTEMALDIDARKALLESDKAPAEALAPKDNSASAGQPTEPTDKPAAGIVAGTEKDPSAALNGAQIKSLLDIVLQVATRQIPRETGIGAMIVAFPITRVQAESVMGEVGKTFFAEVSSGQGSGEIDQKPARESPDPGSKEASDPDPKAGDASLSKTSRSDD